MCVCPLPSHMWLWVYNSKWVWTSGTDMRRDQPQVCVYVCDDKVGRHIHQRRRRTRSRVCVWESRGERLNEILRDSAGLRGDRKSRPAARWRETLKDSQQDTQREANQYTHTHTTNPWNKPVSLLNAEMEGKLQENKTALNLDCKTAESIRPVSLSL